jgi:acyl carrier protein
MLVIARMPKTIFSPQVFSSPAMKTKIRLQYIVQNLGVPPALLREDAHFGKDMGLDSLEIADLMVQVETMFRVRIPAAEYNHLQSIDDLAIFLEHRRFLAAQRREIPWQNQPPLPEWGQ